MYVHSYMCTLCRPTAGLQKPNGRSFPTTRPPTEPRSSTAQRSPAGPGRAGRRRAAGAAVRLPEPPRAAPCPRGERTKRHCRDPALGGRCPSGTGRPREAARPRSREGGGTAGSPARPRAALGALRCPLPAAPRGDGAAAAQPCIAASGVGGTGGTPRRGRDRRGGSAAALPLAVLNYMVLTPKPIRTAYFMSKDSGGVEM